MRETLEALAEGDISVAEAEAALAGYATTDAGRFDAARETRRGVPEGIYAAGKTPAEVATLAAAAVETAGRALVTRADADDAAAVRAEFGDEVSFEHDERSGVVVVHGPDFAAPDIDATVTVVTGGTADAVPAGEAAAVAGEMGATVERIDDVGVANLTRITDQIDALRAADVLIVAAGREGALPTVVAGLVDTPVIGLPVAAGYGMGGDGDAALYGMLQSCTVLSVVNIDAGYVAGAQAGLIARTVAAARD